MRRTRPRRGFGLAMAIGLVAVLSGCWLQPGYGPSRQNSDPLENTLTAANVGSLAPVWSTPIDLESASASAPGGAGGATADQPLVTGSAVIVSGRVPNTDRYGVVALSQATGQQIWRHELPPTNGLGVGSVVAAGADTVLVTWGETFGPRLLLAALRADDGATLSGLDLGSANPVDRFVVGNGIVAYSDPTTHVLVVRDSTTLQPLWRSSTEARSPLIAWDRIWALDPTAPGGTALVAFPAGGCGADTCASTATVALPPPAGAFDGLSFSLLAMADDGHALLARRSEWSGALRNDDLVAVATAGGSTWEIQAQGVESAAVAGDTVYPLLHDTDPALPPELSAVDLATGAVRWQADQPALSGVPIVAGGLVYARAADGTRVYRADGCGAAACSPIATIGSADTPVPGDAPVVSEGSLFADGTVGGVRQVVRYAPTAPAG